MVVEMKRIALINYHSLLSCSERQQTGLLVEMLKHHFLCFVFKLFFFAKATFCEHASSQNLNLARGTRANTGLVDHNDILTAACTARLEFERQVASRT